MGLLHSRASKRRDRAEAQLLEEQARQVRGERRAAGRAAREEAADGLPAWRQPTLGGALRKMAQDRRERGS